MSYITGKPFIHEVLSQLSGEVLQEIYELINTPNPSVSATLRTYSIGNLKATLQLSDLNVGDCGYVNLSFNPVSQDYYKGLLICYGENKFAFFSWVPNSKNMFEVKLLTQDTYEYINEQLTTEEFRRELNDLLVNAGENPDDNIVSPKEVPGYQATATVVINPLTNLNGRVLSAYETNLIEKDPPTVWYSHYTITKGGEVLTKEQAANYMEFMTGSRFVPEYNYEKPQNSLWIMADGTFLKPQWDSENGMCLYLLTNPFGEGGAKLYKHDVYVEHLVTGTDELEDEFYFTIYSFYSEPVEGLEDMCDCISSANTGIIFCYEGGRDCGYVGCINSYGNRPIFNFKGVPLIEGESIIEFDSDGEYFGTWEDTITEI